MDKRLISCWRTAILAVLLLPLGACQLARTPNLAADTNLYRQVVATLPAPAALPDYQTVQQSYLQSGDVAQSAGHFQRFQQLLEKTEPADCLQLPWQQLQQQNLLQLAFYRLALQCQLHHGQQAQAAVLRGYQAWVRDGILRSGNGENSYSAWEVNSFTNALELTGLLGMSVQDYYGVLSANGNSLHYEVHVFDALENRYRVLYFDNQRYIHAFENTPFPFIALSDGWRQGLLPEGAKSNPALMVPLAKALFEEKKPLEAQALLIQAIERKSFQAAVLLADWCFRPDSQLTVSKSQCLGWLLEAADQDFLPALDLILYLQFSKQVPMAPDASIAALQQYINERAKPGRAELQLARYLLQEHRPAADADKAIALLQQAAAAGYPEAAAYATLIQAEQKRLPAAKISEQLQQLAQQGSSVAAYLYVSDLLQQDTLTTAQQASIGPLLKQSAQAGHPEAYYLLGVVSENGLLQDPTAAVAYYRKSAEHYFSRAMLRLGSLYRDGQGVKADPLQASRWFYLCTRQGNPSCAFQAGVMLDDGNGLPEDTAAAIRLYQYAVEQGHAGAMNRLALLYLFGKGVPADSQKALQLLNSAASKGSDSASYYLGLLYFDGQLVQRDLTKARQYFEQAGQHPDAQYYLQHWQALSSGALAPPPR